MRRRALALFDEARHIWPSAEALRGAATPKAEIGVSV